MNFEQKKNLFIVIGLFVVAILVVFSGLYQVNPIFSVFLGGLLILVGCISPAFDFYKERQNRVDFGKKLNKLLKRTQKFLLIFNCKFNIKTTCKELEEKGIKLTIQEVNYRVIANTLFNLSKNEKNIIYILSLCKEIEICSDEIIKSDLRKSISDELSKFDFYNIDEDTNKLLCAFSNLKRIIEGNNKQSISLNAVFQAEIEPRSELFNFLQKYGNLHILGLGLFNDLKKSEEFRRTLSKLLIRGELPSKLVNKIAVDNIRKKLAERGKNSSAFVLVSNKFQKIDSFDNALENFPQIKIGTKYPLNFPNSAKFLHMRIIYPDKYYKSAEDFLEREIVNTIPESKKFDGFVALMPLEMTELATFPPMEEAYQWSNYVRDSYESLNYLQTGFPWSYVDIITESLKSKISILELLSIIPFNIFIPNVDEDAKDCIINHYHKIRENFRINTLFQWCDVDYELLGKYLFSLSCGDIITEEKWIESAKEIVNEAKKLSDTILGSDLNSMK